MNKHEEVVNILETHIHQEPDGTFTLDNSDHITLGIDRNIFLDLLNSLERTNDLIRSGEIDPSDII